MRKALVERDTDDGSVALSEPVFTAPGLKLLTPKWNAAIVNVSYTSVLWRRGGS